MGCPTRSFISGGKDADHSRRLAVVYHGLPAVVAILIVIAEAGVDAPGILDYVRNVVNRSRISIRIGEPLKSIQNVVVELRVDTLVDGIMGNPLRLPGNADGIVGARSQPAQRPHHVRSVTVVIMRRGVPVTQHVSPAFPPGLVVASPPPGKGGMGSVHSGVQIGQQPSQPGYAQLVPYAVRFDGS